MPCASKMTLITESKRKGVLRSRRFDVAESKYGKYVQSTVANV